ncbi:sulfate/thiosulfate import ATP-binding protein CysA [Brevundimonas intermedia]|uniref:Sulfate/thiosulfate import ATP-binding protein CysA n=1 Tax=Brevundimonas intermedia TaxID=74315 RepID=A0ABQ5T4H5_9CAUL|nr:sulfate/molybdate ABC transporter ATP-binding protein [Brevundimonas intermedia]GLK47662.1 sulfate/thiosulfate import ATP-binding protein CysA [Brevundimonas intermedia]
MPLSIQNLTKTFQGFSALDAINLEVGDGEFLALLGPSGSGKTTLLRIMAGLDRPDSGTVDFDGEDFLAQTPRQRRVGLVFQHYALFRHMTVADNIAFGLKVRPRAQRPSKAAVAERVSELLRLVHLEGLEKRYPAQLSGGQRQRVALARALAIQPRLLLLDEPFGALDAKVRRELRRWLRHIHDETGVTTVFVTHDQEEALDLADRVAILNAGRIEQIASPLDLYQRPASAFVHDFLGGAVQLPGQVSDGELIVEGWRTRAPDGAPTGQVILGARGEDLSLADEGLETRIVSVSPRGFRTRVAVEIKGHMLDLDRPAHDPISDLAPGRTVRLRPDPIQLFKA